MRWGLEKIHSGELDLRGEDFRDADLRGLDLVGRDLRDADLRGARLDGAKLHKAYLQRARLDGASLLGADLCGVLAIGTSLRDADLTLAVLATSTLSSADLRGAVFAGTDMRWVWDLHSGAKLPRTMRAGEAAWVPWVAWWDAGAVELAVGPLQRSLSWWREHGLSTDRQCVAPYDWARAQLAAVEAAEALYLEGP